jgi:hypothetical protein
MPTIKVERLRKDGPFQVGATYSVAAGERDEHFSGVVVGVRPTGPRHVQVEVELSDAEHERLLSTNTSSTRRSKMVKPSQAPPNTKRRNCTKIWRRLLRS